MRSRVAPVHSRPIGTMRYGGKALELPAKEVGTTPNFRRNNKHDRKKRKRILAKLNGKKK